MIPTPPEPAAAPAAPSKAAELDRFLVRGIAWTGAAKYGTQIIRWASTLAVVRMLVPEDYGILAMASLFLGLVTMLTEFGVGSAVVTLRDLDDDDVSQLNGASILFGVVACLFTCVMAKPLALFYRSPELFPVMLALSAGFVVRSFRTIPTALLERELRFKLFAAFEAIEAVVLAVAMVLFALAGLGYWTLVLGQLVSGVLGTVLLLSQRRHQLAWPRLKRIRRALVFSGHLVGSRLTWYWYSNADRLVCGRFLGEAPLGTYGVGQELASVPVEKITALVGRVTPAFFAAVQDDNAALRRYLLGVTEGIAVLTIPACWGLAIVADTFVPVILGPKWMEAILPMRLLAIYAAWRSIEALFHQVLVAKKDARFGMWTGVVCALVLPVAFLFGLDLGGTTGIAAAWMAVHPLVLLPLYRRVLRRIELPPWRFLGALWPSVCSALVMVAVVLLVRTALPVHSLGVRLAAEVAAGAVAYALTLLVCFRSRVRRFKETLRTLRAR